MVPQADQLTCDGDLLDQVSDDDRVYVWRADRLIELGLPLHDAVELAATRIDWHDAERLVRRGCPPHTVARILT